MSAIRVLVAIIEMGGFRLFFYHIVSCGQIMCLLCVLCYWDVDGFLLLRVFALSLVRVRYYLYLLEIKSSALCLKVACSQNAACLALTFRCPNKTAINIATSLFPTKYFHVQSADL